MPARSGRLASVRPARPTLISTPRSIRGTLLRTHVLRPTWHIVPADDIRWMLELTAPRVRARMAVYDRRLGLDDAAFARSNRALGNALRGGRHVTRSEAAQILANAGIDAAETQRLGHLMMRAELDGVVVSGVRRGKQSTYALLDERVRTRRRCLA